MDVEKLFNDLESNNSQEYEDTKKKLTEVFSQTKEQWLVQGMLDYYLITNSSRIIEILVKVQSPHDIYIFDRLSDWLRGQNRLPSLTVFNFIVRKHPTWLYKIAKHRLMKDILKLLQTEKEIIPLMSALLSIITLLPIIPSLIPNFLSELFDVFGHLASWNCQNPNKLSENQLIHLQIGLYMLFHRLYGMYPCHFISYLREFKDKEKGAIFHHTIKPLLETVRMHPLLVTATKESEINSVRWKEMEPHDVVVECAKLSLDYYQDNSSECFASVPLRSQESFCGGGGGSASGNNEIPASVQLQTSLRDSQFQATASSFYSFLQKELNDNHQNSDTIWSPSIDILATPPPTGSTVPHTPTPSYGVPLATTGGSAITNNSNNLLGGTGASPPEAAVEATPDTTPMKDINVKRVIASNSPVIRAILPSSSQPSSPMRKEQSPFNFPESSSGQLFTTAAYNVEQTTTTTTTTTTKITASQRRLMQLVNDRNQIMMSGGGQKQLVGQLSLPSDTLGQMLETSGSGGGGAGSVIQQSFVVEEQQPQKVFAKFSSGFVPPSSLDSPTNVTESTQDEQETTTEPTCGGARHSDTLQDISNEYGDDDGDDDDDDETERSPCSVGGLHVPSNRSIQIFAQRIRRNRMASYCYNDTSSYLSYGTSPADNASNNGTDINNDDDTSLLKNAKVRRVKSWHAIDERSYCSLTDENNYCCCMENDNNNLLINNNNNNNCNSNDHQQQQQQQQNGGDSSSPSGDDAISAATHFKKLQQKKERKLLCNQQQQQQRQQQQQSLNKNSLRNHQHQSHPPYRPHSHNQQHHHHRHHHLNHCNRNNQIRNTVETQTIQQWPPSPQIYECNLFEILNEDNRLRLKLSSSLSSAEMNTIVAAAATATTTTTTTKLHQPSEIILENYIERVINMKQQQHSTTQYTQQQYDTRTREDILKDQIQLLQLQLQFEHYRREIHSERNRRLLGKNRELRSLQMDNDRLKDQLMKLQDEYHKLTLHIENLRHLNYEKEYEQQQQLNQLKLKYHTELDDNKKLRQTIEILQRRLNDEIKQKHEINYEIEILHGEIFDLRNDMQQAQLQAELGTQYRLELTKLESEFLVMGEIQIKCRDKLNELNNQKAKEHEIAHIQEGYSDEIKELRSIVETKSAQLDAARHKLSEIQSQLTNKEVMFTDQKRLLKSVKEEYEEKFRALNNKYEVQKSIILSMEQTIFELYKSQFPVNLATFSPELDKTDIAGSVDHTSPLSISLASSEGLSASLRSFPELRNLQALVVQPTNTASGNTTATTITATTSKNSNISSSKQQQQQQQIASASNSRRGSSNIQHTSSAIFPTNQQLSSALSSGLSTRNARSSSSIPNISHHRIASISNTTVIASPPSLSSSTSSPSGTRQHSASSLDIPVPGPSQHHSNLRHHR